MLESWEGTQLEVHFNVEGAEKPKKQTISHVTEEASPEKMIQFGQALGKLAPANQSFDSVVAVKRSRIVAE